MEQIEKFTIEFFENLRCKISREEEVYIVSRVPKSFEDMYGINSPYRFNFEKEVEGTEYILKGSKLLSTIMKYLESAGKTTLLKIDFEVDPTVEINKLLSLSNCEITGLTRRHKNNFFSRFTFVTTFRYLNESPQVVNEIYVIDGEIVKGDLSGYKIIEGDKENADSSHLEKDYEASTEYLKGILNAKTEEVSKDLGNRLQEEIIRVSGHYDILLGELGGDLNSKLDRINELEFELKTADEEKTKDLLGKLERLRKSLAKAGDDDAKERIIKEKDFTLLDVQHKYSLNIDNKLVNTTVIYYPLFIFNLYLKGDSTKKYVEMSYDPLKGKLQELHCETCETSLKKINLCNSSHVTCENCLAHCGECGGQYCLKCLKKSCSSCGRVLCRDCSKMCLGCGKNTCSTHYRKDSATGDERCVMCLRACLRCHELSSPKYFSESMDGSKVCQKCIGEENRNKVLKGVFRDE